LDGSGAIEVGEFAAMEAATRRGAARAEARFLGLTFAGTAIETAEAEALARVEARIRGLSKDERKGCCAKFLDELEPFTLAAYLRNARSDEEEAVRRLLASAEWREGFGASSLLEDASFEIDRFFGDGTREVEWLPAEADQTALGRGNPVLLYRSASHAPLGRPTEDWVRFFVYQCEKVRRDTPDKQVVVLVDRVGSGLKNQDPTVLRAIAPLIANHFPQLIGRVDVAPVSPVLFIIWRIICLILDPAIVQVFNLVEGENWREKLLETYAAKALPERLGGTNTAM